jgi:hypothetical protein
MTTGAFDFGIKDLAFGADHSDARLTVKLLPPELNNDGIASSAPVFASTIMGQFDTGQDKRRKPDPPTPRLSRGQGVTACGS